MDFRKSQPFIDMNGCWSFAYSEGPIDVEYCTAEDLQLDGYKIYPCTVPCNFELDLQENGIIEEPFFGMNSVGLRKYERSHVWYIKNFDAESRPGHDAELIFEGLDCFADVYLNGEYIGSCDNMLVAQVFNVAWLLQEKNELLVHIRPAVEEAKNYDYPPQVITFPGNYEGLYVRKAPHMYGWDIMPRAVSAGIWRPVKLRYIPTERLEKVFLEMISASRESARMLLHYRITMVGNAEDVYEIRIMGRCGESEFSEKVRATFSAGSFFFNVSNPALWWPRGRGEANLYDVKVSLLKNGEELDNLEFAHGIRTVVLDRTSTTDAAGSGEFCFKINGEKVFVIGTNWAPVDAFHSRDAERIPTVIDFVEDIGCNMIRCWGGNVYEDNLFYDLCDRKGIMIWQDFTMACALYPQDEDFRRRLEAEARMVVSRLRQHPSVVLWSGDNECDWSYGWGGRKGNPNDNALTREVLLRVVREEDPTRPYLPSSPYFDAEACKQGGNVPENHMWGVRNYYKSDFYKNSICHFASEVGYHGCPSLKSIRKFISPEKLWPISDNDEWLLHTTTPVPGVSLFPDWTELMTNQIKELFGVSPDNLEDFAFASQSMQGEAFKFFVEFFRSTKWRRTGIIWWNIIDGWPQMSNAVVDYYFETKLAYHFLKRAQQPLCLMMRESEGWTQALVAANDTRKDIELDYSLKDVDTGEVLAEGHAVAAADSTTVLTNIPACAGDKRFCLIEWKTPDSTGVNHYLLGNPPFDLEKYRGWMQKAGFDWTSE